MTAAGAGRALGAYRREMACLRASGRATEHSYRPALRTLIEALGGDGVRALDEPAHTACGAPDFIVERGGVPVGHVECKDVGAHLDRAEVGEQLRRYRDGLPNLILTDYLEFRWYAAGSPRMSARLADPGGAAGVAALFEAFFAADGPRVGDARELARRIAAKARLLRDGIARILAQDGAAGPLGDLLAAYRRVLIADLSPAAFADLQAQTAACGLFAARCLHDPRAGRFTRQAAAFAETTPFLRDLFGRIAGPGIDPRIAWIADDLADLLDRADMAAVLAAFGRREDPVVHFYEDFLAAYDPALRERRGVYYTPEPVVGYVVRSIDRLLRDRFALADGLAQAADDGTRPVLILDPAAGTGTFLREAVACIRATVEAKGLAGAWPDYARDRLLPRLFGFELLMAPYAVCHLKLALEIGGAGLRLPAGRRLGVFLTNALEEAHEGTTGALFAHEIAREAASADAVKREKPVMVVLGNPPYSGHSANKGRWIAGLLRGRDGAAATGSYFHVDGRPLGEKNPKWLNDDYVKFIRFAQWRIERTGEGVLGFVTNHAWLDNPTFRGMRRSLMETFDEIRLLDLHGNAKKKERAPDGSKDENVFDIQQGVAIGLFVKRRGAGGDPARVFHADLWGAREDKAGGGKYGWLAANDVETTEWTELAPKPPFYLFVPRDETLSEEYEAYAGIAEIFPLNSVGIVTTHDQFAISWTREEADRQGRAPSGHRVGGGGARPLAALFAEPVAVPPGQTRARRRRVAGPDRAGALPPVRHARDRVRPQRRRHAPRARHAPHAGRAKPGALRRARRTGRRVGRTGTSLSSRRPLRTSTCSGAAATASFLSTSIRRQTVRAKPNLDPRFMDDLRGKLGLDFAPEDVFHYLYAVLHSPQYRRRYADFLKSDFPRIPLTGDRDLFADLARLGNRLADLHLMEAEGQDPPAFPVAGSNRITRARHAGDRAWINDDQYFDGVARTTWEFAVGGYRPAEKWLKDRKGRTLALDDVERYRSLCAALAETPRLATAIDHGIAGQGADRRPLLSSPLQGGGREGGPAPGCAGIARSANQDAGLRPARPAGRRRSHAVHG